MTFRVMSNAVKIATSCGIWFSTFTLGLTVSFIAASLLELSGKYNVDVSTISKVFSVLTISFLLGAISSGALYNYLNRQLVAGVMLIGMGLGNIAMPLAPTIPTFFCVAALVGITCGSYDTAQIVWMIEMWENKAQVYIQVQHFAFAIGAFASPLLVKPFLSQDQVEAVVQVTVTPGGAAADSLESIESNTNVTTPSSSSDLQNITSISNWSLRGNVLETHQVQGSQLFIPFSIGGIIAILGALYILFLYIFARYEAPPKNKGQEVCAAAAAAGTDQGQTLTKSRTLIALSGLFLGGYAAMELCSSQFIPAYCHYIDLALSRQDGAIVLSGFAGAFTIGRGLGIILCSRVSAELLLLGNGLLLLIGNLILLFLANNSLSGLWAGTIVLGLGHSTVFPSFYVFLEQYLKVTNFVGAVMILAGGLVSGIYPLIVGSWIEESPPILIYVNLFSLLVCLICFSLIYKVTACRIGKSMTIAH